MEVNLEDIQDPEEKKRLIKESQLASINTSDSKSLAAYVIAYRSLGMSKDIAIACMTELHKRRKNGEVFDYESYIESEVDKIPKLKGTDYAKIIKGIQGNLNK